MSSISCDYSDESTYYLSIKPSDLAQAQSAAAIAGLKGEDDDNDVNSVKDPSNPSGLSLSDINTANITSNIAGDSDAVSSNSRRRSLRSVQNRI